MKSLILVAAVALAGVAAQPAAAAEGAGHPFALRTPGISTATSPRAVARRPVARHHVRAARPAPVAAPATTN